MESTSGKCDRAATKQQTQEALEQAILYALKCGCLFEHTRRPQAPSRMTDMVKWGAMRHLHDAIAAHFRLAEHGIEIREV